VIDPDKPSNAAESRLLTDEYWYTFLKKEKRKRRRRNQAFRLLMTLVWLGVPLLVIGFIDFLHTLHK
jgi:hypothetical protein